MDGKRLRDLPLGMRVGLCALSVVLLIGLGASMTHLIWHHEMRDERSGMTYDDVRGAYHGMTTIAPLRSALERGHPESLDKAQRDALLDWLLGKADAVGKRPGSNPGLSDLYDNPDLGADAPAEIISRSCLECHSRRVSAEYPGAARYPLERWDDVRAISISREIKPADPKKLVISVHAHALSLGTLSLVVCVLLWLTRWPRGLVSVSVALAGVGLVADFAGQLLARPYGGAVAAIVAGGVVYTSVTTVQVLAVMAEMLLPSKRPGAGTG
jgi:hypothetical protein